MENSFILVARILRNLGWTLKRVARTLKMSESGVSRALRRVTGPRKLAQSAKNRIKKRRALVEVVARLRSVKTLRFFARGRPPKNGLRPFVERKVRDVQRFSSLSLVRAELARRGVNVCRSTVRKDLYFLGRVPKIRGKHTTSCEEDILETKNFAKSVLPRLSHSFLTHLFFCDEKLYTTNESYRYEWVKEGGRATPRESARYARGRVFAFGFIGFNFKKLIMFDADSSYRLRGVDYISMCLKNKDIFAKLTARDSVLVQDNAGCHKSTEVKNFFSTHKISLLEIPPRSPKCNVIEKLWGIHQQKVETKLPVDKQSLLKAMKEAWEEIPISTVNNLIFSFPAVLKDL